MFSDAAFDNPLSAASSISPSAARIHFQQEDDEVDSHTGHFDSDCISHNRLSSVHFDDEGTDQRNPRVRSVAESVTPRRRISTSAVLSASLIFTKTKMPPEIDVFHPHFSLKSWPDLDASCGTRTPAEPAEKEMTDEEETRPLVDPKDMTYENLFGCQEDRQPPSEFHFDVFVFEFFTQVFHPLLLPLVLLRQGRIAAENKGYIWASSSRMSQETFVRNSINTLMAALPLLLAVATGSRWALMPLVIGECFVMFRYFVIAGKYATYRTRDYLTVLSVEAHSVTQKILTSAWLDVPEHNRRGAC